ncbi:glycosyltransferase [Flavihumibacter sp. R14]|nr:glycosyltransferase [Flavihumibacter soli]
MKVLHLNTYRDNGGAGKAAGRLNHALQQEGVDSQLWVNFSFDKHNSGNTISGSFVRRGITAAGIILERIMAKLLLKPLKTPFSFPFWGTDISDHPAILNADLLHIHWINHGFLRPADLAKLKSLNKPIVWTFHDSNAFTGGCHVRYACNHFENECGNCPLLKRSAPDDWSHRIWKQKQKAYSRLEFEIIAPSVWMANSVKRSKLLGDRTIHQLPNSVNTNTFRPIDKTQAREALGISKDKFIMLSGFMPSRNDLHKGTSYLLEALEIISGEIPAGDIELIVFGNRDRENVPEFPVKTTFLGRIDNESDLAECYSAADVFLAPSLEDNLPYTVMESLACGTPVAGFKTGGIPDMVDHLYNGYLAEYKSSEDLAKGIYWLYRSKDRETINRNSRQTVMDRFSEPVIAAQHIRLYNSLLKNDVPA